MVFLLANRWRSKETFSTIIHIKIIMILEKSSLLVAGAEEEERPEEDTKKTRRFFKRRVGCYQTLFPVRQGNYRTGAFQAGIGPSLKN